MLIPSPLSSLRLVAYLITYRNQYMLRRLSLTSFLEIFLLVLPILWFFTYVYIFAVNVPYLDDMGLIETINDFRAQPENLFKILVGQHNDHRIFFSRASLLIVYLLSGTVNFRLITILGFTNLLLLTFSFYLIYRQYRKDLLGFLPIPFLLFSALLYYVHLTSLTAYQSSLSVAFSILSLYFLQNSHQKQWYLSVVFACASTLTMLDGISVIPIGFAWLLIQRRFKEGLIFGIICGSWLLLYFSNFHFSSSSKLTYTSASLITVLKGFVIFTGSFSRLFSDTYRIDLSFALGILIISGSLAIILYRIAEKSSLTKLPRFVGFSLNRIELLDLILIRMFATGAMISVGRAALNLEDMVAIRFQVYALSIIVISYLFLIRSMGIYYNKACSILVLVISLLCNVYAYSKYQNTLIELRNGLIADSYNYTHNQVFLHQYFNLPDPQPSFYRNYSFPVFFDNTVLEGWESSQTNTNNITITSQEIPTLRQPGGYIYNIIEIKIEHVPSVVPHSEVFLVLRPKNILDKKYFIGVNTGGNSISEILFPSSEQTFHGKFLDKVSRNKYEARLCWIENKKPRSILISTDFFLDSLGNKDIPLNRKI